MKISSKEVTDYRNKDVDTIIIASSIVEEQFKPVKEFSKLFLKTIATELPSLKEVNYQINPIPG